MKKRSLHYQRAMVIVHGRSELAICENIRSNLRLSQEVIGKNKGKESIQITSVMQLLADRRFQTPAGFGRAFEKVEFVKNRPQAFRLFIIMDTDDCTPAQREAFVTGGMFQTHWLAPYIVPIYNTPNLEQTMRQAGIPVEKKKDYIALFPVHHGDLDLGVVKQLRDKLKKLDCTNLDVYLDYCIQLAEKDL